MSASATSTPPRGVGLAPTSLLSGLVERARQVSSILGPVLYKCYLEKGSTPSRALIADLSKRLGRGTVGTSIEESRLSGLIQQAFRESDVPDVLRVTAGLITEPD